MHRPGRPACQFKNPLCCIFGAQQSAAPVRDLRLDVLSLLPALPTSFDADISFRRVLTDLSLGTRSITLPDQASCSSVHGPRLLVNRALKVAKQPASLAMAGPARCQGALTALGLILLAAHGAAAANPQVGLPPAADNPPADGFTAPQPTPPPSGSRSHHTFPPPAVHNVVGQHPAEL